MATSVSISFYIREYDVKPLYDFLKTIRPPDGIRRPWGELIMAFNLIMDEEEKEDIIEMKTKKPLRCPKCNSGNQLFTHAQFTEYTSKLMISLECLGCEHTWKAIVPLKFLD